MQEPASLLKLLKAIRKGSGFAQARGRDPDFEQAVLRVVISLLVFSYASVVVASGVGFTHGLIVALSCSGGNALVGAWMCWWLKKHSDRPDALRYLGICSDLISVTIGMAGGDEAGVPLIGVYLWVTVGNGFRFGPRYLLIAYWLSLVGFLALMAFVPFWQTHRPLGVGFTLILAGVPLYVLVLLSRLTAQKNEAEQLSNAKSRFVANVSHELRTPLAGVFAVHELLRMRKMPTADQELVGMLGSAIGTLKESVDAVLQMSKLEAGAERAEPRPFNLWYFLQQIEALCRPQATAKRLAWTVQVERDVPCAVVGDPNHLSHALGNLINNAFKFTARGSVTLGVRQCNGDRIHFDVTDTGLGIPVEHQERLFERFMQVDISARRRYGGTGLGTSIAHDLVQLMGGEIGVVSAQGQGSRFWIELPLPAASLDIPPQAPRGSRDVLLISSPSSLRDEFASTFESLGLLVSAPDPNSRDACSFASNEYAAAFLIMSASEACSYSERVLKGRAGTICPWFVLAPVFSTTQFSALQNLGAAGLFHQSITAKELRVQLGALESRLQSSEAHTTAAIRQSGLIRSLNVLLADDNASNRLLFTRILEDSGHTVLTAERGDQAFDLMSSSDIDLALLDLNMPDISGPDVVKLFRASSIGTRKLPIVILSADATPAAKVESIQAGADEFLTKPVSASTLLATIERLIAGTDLHGTPQPQTSVSNAGREETFDAIAEAVAPSGHMQLVDSDRIQSLKRIARGEKKFLEQYVAVAFSELEDAIGKVRIAVASGNMLAARDALHIIVGTGASVGADALVQNAKLLGRHLSEAPSATRPNALAELSTTYALTKSTVWAMIFDQFGANAASGTSH